MRPLIEARRGSALPPLFLIDQRNVAGISPRGATAGETAKISHIVKHISSPIPARVKRRGTTHKIVDGTVGFCLMVHTFVY